MHFFQWTVVAAVYPCGIKAFPSCKLSDKSSYLRCMVCVEHFDKLTIACVVIQDIIYLSYVHVANVQ